MTQDINQTTQGPDVIWHYSWGDANRNPLTPDQGTDNRQKTDTTKIQLKKPIILGLLIWICVRSYSQE